MTANEERVVERVKEAFQSGWNCCLIEIRASLKNYPDSGGDVEIMKAIDEIVMRSKDAR